ncbi:MAG: T9SS type B sorting domain-containing protein [Saprospiraceae bacterium]|nr:T9SS type B sorting domain-containing protein [Saprospiraceae bacterium]
MNINKQLILLGLLVLSCMGNLQATHNRAGEITYRQLGPLTILATITTYTKASSASADRDTLELFWGDGTSTFVPRANGQGELIPGEDIKINYYTAEHTYPGRATYKLSFNDPNRVGNIQNVNFPNSVDVRFYVETTFTLTNTQFQGFNNSVELLQPPIDFACVNSRFVHNPNAFDPDGDSISYELIVPLESEGMEVPKYELPNEAAFPGPDNVITLDPVTGDFVWDSPKTPGEYNIAIRINEYRNGILLNSVIRDMQIFVDICTTLPPEIDVVDEICVIAGEEINIPVIVTDPDTDELVRLSATGGPFRTRRSSADLTGNGDYTVQALKEQFIWQTTCEHISDAYYQVVFRAQDNSRGTTGFATLKTMRIKVVGPPPEDVQGQTVGENSIRIDWDFNYSCKDTEDDYFIGFSVWRKTNPNPFEIDTCTTGLDGRGYIPVNFLTNQNDGSRYFHVDDLDLEKGRIYCYRVLANFALRTPSGNPYNITESIPSAEICLQLSQDIPLITEVSVNETAVFSGVMDVSWIKPLASDLDTIENPGPYRYVLKRSTDGINYTAVAGADYTTNSFAEPIQLSFQDSGLNTLTVQYYYTVDFYSNNILYGSSLPASSIFLNITSSDNLNALSWSYDVPWQNFKYHVYRQSGNQYNVIATLEEENYQDFNVENDDEYCYYIEAEGTYGLSSTPPLLINLSQEVCGTPIDTVGPCAPAIAVENPCDLIGENVTPSELINTISWSSVKFECINSQDIQGYNIYYSDNINETVEFIGYVEDDTFNSYEHLPSEGISGCYAVSSVDSLGNEGLLSELVCVDNCPVYTLPNTFTPNNDGANELFVPIENRFVSSIDFKVYNRWGNLIFQTNDPEINWNGTMDNGTEVDEGTYYYVCAVFEQTIEGNVSQSLLLEGNIQIFR